MATGEAQESLHQRARQARSHAFGKSVFVRAVVEISNHCRQNCSYCGMRRENRLLERYRARFDALAELLLHHCPPSVTDINLQAGEDPVAVRKVALPLIRLLRQETNLGVTVCLGTLHEELYSELKQAGAAVYILKFETSSSERYSDLNSPGTLQERIEHIQLLKSQGWRVSSGFIAGLPAETEHELVDNLRLAAELPLDGCSVSPFIPGEETPLRGAPNANIETVLNAMALLRLMRPDWVIPAVSALNLSQPGSGYVRGLKAGANLVTINLTPTEMRQDYLLYKRDRFIMTEERILQAVQAAGLEPSKSGLVEYYSSVSAKQGAAA